MQPSESPPVPWLVSAADPGVVLWSSVPSHQELTSVLSLVFTPAAQIFSGLVFDLPAACFLATDAHVRVGLLRGTRLLKPGVWAPIAAFGSSWGAEVRGSFSAKLGETLWGGSVRFSALYKKGVHCRRWPRGRCQGQCRREGRGTILQEHSVFDPSATALKHLLSPTRNVFLCVLESGLSGGRHMSPPSH